jgi:GNAT superfamily N-acetyltransferase
VENLLANWRAYLLEWGGEPDDAVIFRSGLPQPQLNGVVRRDARPVAEILAEARERLDGLPWRWWVGPDEPADTGELLRGLGGRRASRAPIMSARVDDLARVPPPDGLTIRETTDLGAWVAAYTSSFGMPREHVAAVWDVEATMTGRVTRIEGRIADRIAGTAAVLEAAGVAGIYVVTVAEGYRRRGIGAAMTSAAIDLARHRGLGVVTLQPSPVGEPLYRRLGFTEVAQYQTFEF